MLSSSGDPLVLRGDLVQQMDVGDGVLDIGTEVVDMSATAGAAQVVVDPADEDLLGGQLH